MTVPQTHKLQPPGPKEIEAWNESVQKEQIDRELTHEAHGAVTRAFLEFQAGVTSFMPDTEGRATLFWTVELDIGKKDHVGINFVSALREDFDNIDDRIFLTVECLEQSPEVFKEPEPMPAGASLHDFVLQLAEPYDQSGAYGQMMFFGIGVSRYLEDTGYVFSAARRQPHEPGSKKASLQYAVYNAQAHYKAVIVTIDFLPIEKDVQFLADVKSGKINLDDLN